MDRYQMTLIGELIGLARATDGNSHLITPESTATLKACLTASPSCEEKLRLYLSRVEETKKRMVPDCFLCANPCGRTNAYDLNLIEHEEPEIRDIKLRILRELRSLARGETDESREMLLYRGLTVIGLEGYCAEELYSMFRSAPE